MSCNMSYRKKLLLFNNFMQSLDGDIRTRIEEYIGDDYDMDNNVILSYFGLENRFNEYMEEYAA